MRKVMDPNRLKDLAKRTRLQRSVYRLMDVLIFCEVLQEVGMVANYLIDDPLYTKEMAAERLLELARDIASEQIGTTRF